MKKKLAFLTILLATTLAVFPAEPTTPTGIPLSEIGTRIDELAEKYMLESTPGMAVAVVKDGEIIFSRGYGFADRKKQIPVDPAVTIFEWASISKLFVYVSIMQLYEQGLIDLDADIHTYLPEDFSRELNFKKTFTIRNLLNHSAGFGENYINAFWETRRIRREPTLREALLAAIPPQIYEPGTLTAYSNFGIALLAYVVREIRGQEFVVVERQNILNPLSMTMTKNQPDWFKNPDFFKTKAVGHEPRDKGGFREVPWWFTPYYPSAGLNGTAEDLARFAIGLTPPQGESGPLFNCRSTLDLMLSPSYSDRNVLIGMYHGFNIYDGVHFAVGHGGSLGGFNSDFVIVPSERFGVVILNNSTNSRAIFTKITDLLVGKGVDELTPPPANLPHASSVEGNFKRLRRAEGTILEFNNYDLMNSDIRVRAVDENTITMVMGGRTRRYRQVEPYVFRQIISDSTISQGRGGLNELRFKMENGKPVAISKTGSTDATLQTFKQRMSTLIGSAIIAGLCALFFLVMPIILLIRFFVRKTKTKATMFQYLSNGLLLTGTLLSISAGILVLFARDHGSRLNANTIAPFTWANYILLILAGILLVASLISLTKHQVAFKRKFLYYSTISILPVLVLVLWWWSFFVMM